MLTTEDVRSLLEYDEATGKCTWRVRVAQRSPAGSPAGSDHSTGYRYVSIRNRNYKLHQIVWLYAHGSWPSMPIDHINGDKKDNRITNLRQVPRSMNVQNQRAPQANNTSGLLGVSKFRDKWKAQISVSGQVRYLGLYPSPERAHAAYVAAKRELHPGCTI